MLAIKTGDNLGEDEGGLIATDPASMDVCTVTECFDLPSGRNLCGTQSDKEICKDDKRLEAGQIRPE